VHLRRDQQHLRPARRAHGHGQFRQTPLPYAAGSAVSEQDLDGPRNDRDLRIWFPFGRGANAGGPTNRLSAARRQPGIFTWSHRDLNFDFTSEPLSLFDDETSSRRAWSRPTANIISTDLRRAKKGGAKILMWHGGADQLIPWRQSVHYYREAAERFDGFRDLQTWFRFTSRRAYALRRRRRPQPQALFDTMVNWVETGNAPASIVSQNATLGSGRCARIRRRRSTTAAAIRSSSRTGTAAGISRRAPMRAWTAWSSTSTRPAGTSRTQTTASTMTIIATGITMTMTMTTITTGTEEKQCDPIGATRR